VAKDSPLIGQSIGTVERSAPRLRIVALKRGDESTRLIPDAATLIDAGDFLVAIGDRDTLRRLS
ncbi:MAG TPA: TrkA C-terminal domain-containing protein, partial [Candidatus Binataceae bacterium]|nr:TrkA C-terminal domain-containing protein [Candidatus Binataceae bacterium]